MTALAVALPGPRLHAQTDTLLTAVQELQDHINGASTLSAAQIEQHKFTIDAQKNRFAETATHISAVFDLVETYDAVKGPLWVALDLEFRA